MLIQTTPYYNNYQFRNKTNPSFKGELGKKVVSEMSKSDNADISEIMKNLGLGNMGVVSSSKVKDILEEVAKNNREVKSREDELERKESSFDRRMQKVREDLSAKEQEMNDKLEKRQTQLSEQEKEFFEQKEATQKELDERETELNEREENISSQAAIRETELDEREKALNSKEKKLNKLEQKIINETRENETERIREEEKEKAFENLADRYTEIAKTEVELDKREQALVSAENIMKQAEIDKIKGDLRVLYDIDDENLQSYDSFGEQMIMISDVFNRHHFALKSDPNPEILDTVTDVLRNNEGGMDKNTVIFLERILRTSDKKMTYPDLCSLALIAKDDAGNLDLEKSCYIIAALSCRNSDPKAAIDACLKHYNLDDTEDKTPNNYILAWGYKEICADSKWTNNDELNDFLSIDFKKCSKSKLIQANKILKITKLWANRKDNQDVYNDLQKITKDLQKIIDEK